MRPIVGASLIDRIAFLFMNLEALKKKHEELQQQLANPETLSDGQAIKRISIELGKIEKAIRDRETEGRGTNASQKIMMEIRAGTGGSEAALFAGELYRMYSNYAKKQDWEVVAIDSHPTTLGGYKEVIFEIGGANAYAEMRHESGVHRVQRIPDTEKIGRIHTSTASVAVLPEAKESDIEIRPQDIRVEFYRSSGPGGQNVNKVETAVRIYHLPSGLVVGSQESRSQQKNREHAMTLLRTRLLDAQRQTETAKTAQARREQIGTAERAEKIRTYNFPQDRITDHRLKKSFHSIEKILEGDLDPIVEAFTKR